MTIPTISTLPTAPARTDAPATFITRADAFLAALVTMQSELNTSIGAMNTDIAGVNANVTLASEWAIKNDAAVSGTDWSAFANASGASPTGSAKAWATTAQDTPVSGGEYSAKHYSTEASDSATAAASSATAAANTANAAMWVSGQAYAEGDNAISGVNYKTYRATTATSGTTDPSASGDWTSLAYNLPSQSGNSGKFLTTNGTAESWGDALPSQTGNTGKVLTTDGTNDTWEYAVANQSGQTGKFLTTDGTTTSWATAGGVGTGGSTTAVPVTLTSSSDSAQNLTSTGWGREVTLPDATTMSEGTPVFFFNNQSKYDIPILNDSGTLLGYILSGDSTMCTLYDNATTDGKWVFSNPQPLGTYAEQFVPAPVASSGTVQSYEKITDTKWMTLHMNSSNLYACVYDITTRTFGSFTLIHSDGTNGMAGIQKLADDTALIVWSWNGSTSVRGVVATVSGTTISLGSVHSQAVSPQTYKCGRLFRFYDVDGNGNNCVSVSRNTSTIIDVIAWKWDGSTSVSSDKYNFSGDNFIACPIGNTGQSNGFLVIANYAGDWNVNTFYVSASGSVTNIASAVSPSSNNDAPEFFSPPNSNGNVMLMVRASGGAFRGMVVSATASSVTANVAAAIPSMPWNPTGPITYMFDAANNRLLLICESGSSNYVTAIYIGDISGSADVQQRSWAANYGATAVGFDDDSAYVATRDVSQFYNTFRYYVDTSNPQPVPNRELADAQQTVEYQTNAPMPFHGTRFFSDEYLFVGSTNTFAFEQGGQTYIPHGRNYIMESERYAMVAWGGGQSGGFGFGLFDRESKAMIKIDPRRAGNMRDYAMNFNNRSIADASEGWDVFSAQDTDSPSNQYFVKMSLKRLANA